MVAAALAPVAAAVALAPMLVGHGDDAAWASAVEVARAAPRLLVGEPGWEITRADQFSVGRGEMTFSRGERQLELTWGPGRESSAALDKRSKERDGLGTIAVAGHTAHVFGGGGSSDFIAIWLHDGITVEARELADDGYTAPQPALPGIDRQPPPASAPNRTSAPLTLAEFKATVASLQRVDVDTWLEAMPDSVVEPATRSQVVDEMLTGVPLPDRFDTTPLARGEAIRDRYQLGAQVAGAVACAWIERWLTARRAEDENGVRRAAEAIASSRGWPILREMNDEGDYPEVLWAYADAIARDRPVMGGRPLTVEESYREALGCGSS